MTGHRAPLIPASPASRGEDAACRYDEREGGSPRETRNWQGPPVVQHWDPLAEQRRLAPVSPPGGVGSVWTSVEPAPGPGPSSPSVEPERFRAFPRSSAPPPGLGAKGAGPGVRSGKPARPQVARRRPAGEEEAPRAGPLGGRGRHRPPRPSRPWRPPSVRTRLCVSPARCARPHRRPDVRAAGSSVRAPPGRGGEWAE